MDAFKTRPYGFLILFFVSILSFNFSLLNAQDIPPFPTDHLQLWLRADSVELTDGKVSRWYDLSPNNYVIQQTNANARPTFNESAINEKPALIFNGSNSYLTGGDILDLGTNSWTWIIVGKSNAIAWNRPYIAKTLYGSEVGRYALSSNRLIYITTNNTEYNVIIPTNAIQTSTWHMITWKNDRSSLKNKIYVNGALIGSSSFPNYNMQNSRYFLIGAYNGANGTTPQTNYYLNGEIAEIIAFNNIDSTIDCNSVYNYLAEKYFPDFLEPAVNLGLDILLPYGFCDTTITTAYNPDFISYQWSTGETDSVIHVNRSGRYTVTVTNSFGVTSTDDINVYFPEVYQMQDTTICSGDTIYWNTGLDQDRYTFQWIKYGIPYANASNRIEIFDAGAYTCVISDSLGCNFQTDTAHIAIDDYPISTTFIADGPWSVQTDTSLCSGNTLGLATNIDETTSYIWNTGASSSRITITESGDYSLTTTNNRGCHAVNSIHVNILGEAPEINYAIDNLCFGDSTSFIGNAQSPQGIESYLWIIDSTDSISTENFNYEFATIGNHNIRTIVTSNNSCRNDSSFSITIKEIAIPDFTFTPVCYGVPMDFIDNSTIPEGTEAESYSWMIEESVIGNEANLTYTFGDASTTLSERRLKHIINLNNGCSADTTIEINISSDYAEPRYVSCAYPTNGMLVNTDSIRFEWNYDYDILYYDLITSSSPDFRNADTTTCTTNNITLLTENFADTTYWKVTSYNHCLLSFESEPYFFRKKSSGTDFISTNPNLQLWLRADSVELTDGKVSRWYDCGPNQYLIQQTTESARPIINDSAINDNPAILFDGSNSYFTGGDILDLGTNSWTWFVIGKSNINAWNRPYIAKSLYGSEVGRYSLSSNRLIYITTNNVEYNVIIPANAIQASNWHVLTWENSRTSLKNYIYANGILQENSSFPNYNMQNSRSFLIGAYNSTNGTTPQPNYYLNGEIAEIIAFNNINSSINNSVYNYLAEKYFPDFLEPSVSLGLDIHVPYGFCDTTITTAYNPDFITYQWSTGETDSVIHVNRSGRYTVTVTNSFGVTSTDDINVYFPEHFQLQDTTICEGDTVYWNIKMRQDEYSFQWYKDGEQYAGASNQIEISEAGAYTCIITDSIGCSFQTDTAHIAIDDYPISAGFGASDTTLCYGNRLHIASGYSETASAIWHDGNTDLEHYLTQPGSYTVTTTNTRGCTATNSINVNLQGQVPIADFSTEGYCQNTEVTATNLSTSAMGDITLYRWYANDSLIGTTENISHIFEQYGSQSLRLYLETNDHCFNDTTIPIYIYPQPQPDFLPKTFCQNAETEINTQHTIAEGEIVSTLWSIEGETLYGDNISKSFAGTDLVPVTITAESAVGCSGIRTYEVVVRQTEKPAMNISGLCLGSATEFTNTTPFSNTNPQIAWEWSFGDNTGISSRKNPVHIYDSIGNYTISMSVTFANHCTTSIDTTISIFLQPEASIITANGCVGGHTEMLANISSDDHISNYKWDIGDIFQSAEAQPIFIADSAGFFPVSLEITTDHLCKAVATGYLNIHGHLNVSFTQSRDWGGSPLYVEFENTSEDATSYHWNFGGAGESSQTNPYFIFTEPGTYEVSLTGTNEFGCTGRYTSPAITVVEPIVDIMLMDLKANEENGFAKISLIIVNLGTLPVEDLVLELKINNQIYRETIGHIAQGAVVPHTFGTMIPIPNSTSIANTICVEALVPDSEGHSETNLANNTLCITDAENLSVGIPYPIPAYEQITCDIYTKIPTDLDISIFSIFGKLVKHETISQHKGYMKYVVNVTDLSGGMYFIRVNSKDENITHKFEIR
ncbi:MAG: PKD domain-containing protein [Bacteroidales bacterium]|nr:PKD domain-containing protein [Bacteroidales bacterium]